MALSSMHHIADADSLVAGLQELRSKRQLCDVILVCGPERFAAHQVVLAAMSNRLCEHFTKCCSEAADDEFDAADPVMKKPPQPVELQLTDIDPEAVRLMLDHVYCVKSEKYKTVSETMRIDILQLGAAFDVPGLKDQCDAKCGDGQTVCLLVEGLCRLRKKVLLCDMLLTAGGEPTPAHQAVMAAASSALRKYVLDDVDVATVQDQAPRPFELELCGVFDPEAVDIMLDHMYGADIRNQETCKFPADAPGREIIRLASAFELPRLRERGVEWLTRNVTEENIADRLATCDEFGLRALRARIFVESSSCTQHAESPASSSAAPAGVPRQPAKAPTPPSEASTPAAESFTLKVLSPEHTRTATEEYILSLSQIKSASFADASVPGDEGLVVATRTKHEAKLRAKLTEMFDLRPVWLQDPLQRMLQCDISVLMRLIPAVAYSWKDGPWQGAFSRLGWDPRDHPDQSKWLQVLNFRDPFFRQHGKKKPRKEDSEEATDCYFRKPPCKRNQPYQFIDIQDDWVQEILCSAPLMKDCCKRDGWLPEDVLDCVRQRLGVKSQQMRDRIAARNLRRPVKRMRVGGG